MRLSGRPDIYGGAGETQPCLDATLNGDRDRGHDHDDRRGGRGDRPDARHGGVHDSGERKFACTSHAGRSRPAGRRRRTRGNGGANRAHSPGVRADRWAVAMARPGRVFPRRVSD